MVIDSVKTVTLGDARLSAFEPEGQTRFSIAR